MDKNGIGFILMVIVAIFVITCATLASVHTNARDAERRMSRAVSDLRRNELEHHFELHSRLLRLETTLDGLKNSLSELKNSLSEPSTDEQTEVKVSVDEIIQALENMKNKGV